MKNDVMIRSRLKSTPCGVRSVPITQEGHVVTGKPFLYPELSKSY